MEENVTSKNNNSKERMKIEKKQLLKILTVQEVADLLRIHRSTVTRLAKSGEIKSYRLGSRRLFKNEDVLEFFENLVDKKYVFGED